jgi:uncharacterized protein (TIGR02246 family)
VRASVAFSKGSHDEWNIWQHVNRLRVATAGDAALGFGSQLPGYFEGRQIDPAASESTISAGYAIEAVIPVAEMTVETDPGRRVEPRGAVERGMGIHGGVIRRAVVMQSADEHAIVQMYETALEAFRREDLEGVLEHWAEDGAYLWPAVSPAIGKVEIRSAYIQFFTAWTAEERFMRHDLTVSGDLAYSRFGTELKLTPKAGGNASLMTLQGTHVYIRVDGHWRFKAVTAVAVPSS